ncbi:hypothetical protein C8R45DRAFT_1097238 [Mycena sanguinolenta]|nr:hypothetical protein C8R45DRAFT_1097238 [Mycena sanguinolenta]
MYWNNDQEWAEENASTGSSTPPTLSQPDMMYRDTNCSWEDEDASTGSSKPPTLCDMYWSNKSECSQAMVSISGSVPTRSGDRPHGPSSCTGWSHGGQMAKDVFHSVLNVRKSWKTLPGGEAVWPPALEAALIEGKTFPLGYRAPLTEVVGLEHYRPDDCRETRMLGRFPMRNCFIAEYIFRTTGKRRSAKQVGSRLQQIRDSCRDEKLLRLLSPLRHPLSASPSQNSFSDLSASPNISSTLRHTVVHINILPEGAIGSETNQMLTEAEVSVRPPRRLSSINPTVAFSSPSLIQAESRCTVYVADRIVHVESTPLTLVSSGHSRGFIYSTTLVPKYWEVISESSDPTQFTVYQEVLKSVDSTLVFSGTYTFGYPTGNSSGSASPVDTPNCASDHLVQAVPAQKFREERYPSYVPPEWRPALPSPRYSPPQLE